MVEVANRAFVGRAAELQRLVAALERARTGEPRAVIVGGEAGIGKSRLIEEFAEDARASGARVLIGGCLELGESGLPYAPFIEALRTLIRETEPGALPALLGPARGELARLLPELASRVPVSPAVAGEEGGPEPTRLSQARLFELVLGVLERLARTQPLVAVIEDLHWADRSTRDLLLFLIRSLRRAPVLFVVTTRSDEIDRHHPLLPLLAELERLDRVERIELRPFSHHELVAQLTAIAGAVPAGALVDRILERTDGNPFYAEQVFAATEEGAGTDLPPLLRDVLLARVAELPERAQEVLRAASAAGRRVDDRMLAAVLDISPRELNAALREVIEKQLLTPVASPDEDTSYQFHHALLQEAVYPELLPGECSRLHAAYADVLGSRAGERGPGTPVAAELAYHWDAARDWRHALPAAVAAGRAAEQVYAFGDGLRWYERALELWDRVEEPGAIEGLDDRAEVLHRAAECACMIGEFAHAVELGRAALAGVDALSNGPRAGLLNERLRWYLWESGDRAAAAEALAAAERLVPADPPSAARARIVGHLAGIDMFAGRYAASAVRARASIEQARAVGARAHEALALGILGWDTAMTDDVDRGVALFREAMTIAQSIDGVEGLGLGYASLSVLLDLVGRTEESLSVAREGYEVIRRLGLAGTYGALLLGSVANACLSLGRWDEADRATRDGLEREPAGRPAIWLHINRGRLETGRGNFAEARVHLELARVADERLGGTEYRSVMLAASAELAVWLGRAEDTRPMVAEGFGRMVEGPPQPGLGWLVAVGLRAEADLAERARARRDGAAETEARRLGDDLADRLVKLSMAVTADGSSELPRGLEQRLEALAALCAAELARLEGTATAEDWSRAAQGWGPLRSPFTIAYLQFRQAGCVLETRGPRQSAGQLLSAAFAASAQLGASPLRKEIGLLARQARLDLDPQIGTSAEQRSSEPASEVSATARLGFTPREEEVLQLVGGGWTNQQIADHLFISRKTASVHVSNILGKLGVDSRVEAAAIAHRLGLATDAPPPPDSVAEVVAG